ncbi:cytochrome c biogenesis protein CcmG, thiol:disulfide interchange protein DsbE [Gammaproteobacteria bacterium]
MPSQFILSLFLFLSSAMATDFSVVDLDGHSQSLAAYRGKWVVVNFWATWCPSCCGEIPDLNTFHRNHHTQDAVVLGLAFDDDTSDAELRNFVRIHSMVYPIARATTTVAHALGAVTGLPTTYLVDPTGKVVARQLGPIAQTDIEDFIRLHPVAHQK